MPSSTGSPWNIPWPTLTDPADGADLGEDIARHLGDPVTGVIGQSWSHATVAARPAHQPGRIISQEDTGLVLIGMSGGRWRKLSGPKEVLGSAGRGGAVSLTSRTPLWEVTVTPPYDGELHIEASIRYEVATAGALRGFVMQIRRTDINGMVLTESGSVLTDIHEVVNLTAKDDFRHDGTFATRTYVVTMESDNTDSVVGTLMSGRIEQ